MTMEKNDVNQIAEAIGQIVNKSESSKILDTVIKFISTASFALVMWVLSTVNAMQKEMVQISANAQYLRGSLSKLESFTEKPIFTMEHYDTKTLPILGALGTLTDSVREIEKRLNASDLERQKLQISIDALEKRR